MKNFIFVWYRKQQKRFGLLAEEKETASKAPTNNAFQIYDAIDLSR